MEQLTWITLLLNLIAFVLIILEVVWWKFESLIFWIWSVSGFRSEYVATDCLQRVSIRVGLTEDFTPITLNSQEWQTFRFGSL